MKGIGSSRAGGIDFFSCSHIILSWDTLEAGQTGTRSRVEVAYYLSNEEGWGYTGTAAPLHSLRQLGIIRFVGQRRDKTPVRAGRQGTTFISLLILEPCSATRRHQKEPQGNCCTR